MTRLVLMKLCMRNFYANHHPKAFPGCVFVQIKPPRLLRFQLPSLRKNESDGRRTFQKRSERTDRYLQIVQLSWILKVGGLILAFEERKIRNIPPSRSITHPAMQICLPLFAKRERDSQEVPSTAVSKKPINVIPGSVYFREIESSKNKTWQ
jgi:hypothetical protein